jgi:hypothetical protein
MGPVGSLPFSKEPSTGPYPEPDQSSPYHPICCLPPACLLVFAELISSTLKMEAICSYETSAETRRTTWRHIPEDDTLLKICRWSFFRICIGFGISQRWIREYCLLGCYQIQVNRCFGEKRWFHLQLLADFLLGLLFEPEDGSSTSLRNISKLRTTWRSILENYYYLKHVCILFNISRVSCIEIT